MGVEGEDLSQYAIVAVFVVMAVVVLGSLTYFRRHSLGTRKRIIMSVLAVVLLTASMLRDGDFGPGKLALLVVMALLLGSGIVFLKNQEDNPPEK